MTHSTPTLRDLFAPADGAHAAALVAALESSPALSSLAGGLASAAGPDAWHQAVHGVAGAIPHLLDIEVGTILAGAWASEGELGRYADPQRYPLGEVLHVELTSHVVTSEHRPGVELLVNDQPYGQLGLTVSVTLQVERASLTITDGKIWQATAGACTATGRIACDTLVLVECPPTRAELPAPLVFADPVPIVPGPAGWDETPLT